jgi:hypothetical protein
MTAKIKRKREPFNLRRGMFESEVQELEHRVKLLERFPLNGFQERLTADQRDRYLAASKRICDLLHEQIGVTYEPA